MSYQESIERRDLYFHRVINFSLNEYENATLNIYYLTDCDGYFHHNILPAVITIFTHEHKKIEYFFSHGVLYRSKYPAKKIYNKCDIITENSKDHTLFYYHEIAKLKDGFTLNKAKEIIKTIKENPFDASFVLSNSYLSRISEGPTLTERSSFGSTHMYLKKNQLHREKGPAYLFFDNDGKEIQSEWYLEGEKIYSREKK